jgi:hypothetical protein
MFFKSKLPEKVIRIRAEAVLHEDATHDEAQEMAEKLKKTFCADEYKISHHSGNVHIILTSGKPAK